MSKIRNSLSQPAYEYLLGRIMRKEMMPGMHISELSIADELGISRTPVRDALRRLANEGLVTIYPNRFVKVSEYSDEDFFNIGTMRIAMETMSVKLASFYGSMADFMRLQEIAVQCYDAILSNDEEGARLLDAGFHMEMARLTNNVLLMKFHEELYLRVEFILLHTVDMVRVENEHMRQHLDIVDAMIKQDIERACFLVQEQLSSFYRLRKRFPEKLFIDHFDRFSGNFVNKNKTEP